MEKVLKFFSLFWALGVFEERGGGWVGGWFFFFLWGGGGLQTRLMDHPIHPFYDMQLKTQSSQIINETLLTLEMEDKIKL